MTQEESVETELEIKEPLHFRPIQVLTLIAQGFGSKVSAVHGEKSCDAKSFLEMLDFAAAISASGAKTFSIRAMGKDAKEAISAMLTLGTKTTEIGPSTKQESHSTEPK